VHDRVDHEMVRSITDIGHVMGKKVVASQVESTAVLERLRQIGCRLRPRQRTRLAVGLGRGCDSYARHHQTRSFESTFSPACVTTFCATVHRGPPATCRLHLHRFDRHLTHRPRVDAPTLRDRHR
jgi:hypothetical protein